MAVYAVHLTRTLQGAPSVFQVTAADALANTVKPALRKLTEYLSVVYPNKCEWLVEWYDELYLLLDLWVQYHYLKHYAASFSESFYGLVRVATASSGEFASGQRLPDLLERGSLVLLVLAPYVRDRAAALVDRWRERHEEGTLGKSQTARLQLAAVRIFTLCQSVYWAACLVQTCRYVCGAARSHSPALAALGVALSYAPPPAAEPDDYTWKDLATSLVTGNIGVAALTFPMLGGLASRAAQYAAFGVQFLRWWDAHAPLHHTALPPPPPPQRDERSVKWKNRCPICLQAWKTPTVLPVSGYVFCYLCISRHLRSRGSCPVTNLPADSRALVRLYID